MTRRFAWILVLLPVGLTAQGAGGQRGAGGGAITSQEVIGPARPLTQLFTQDAYTEYALLEPGSESFRIRFLPETRAGSTELTNETRGGSEGSGVEVYDPRTGKAYALVKENPKPGEFVYEPIPNDTEGHRIRAALPIKVPEGGIGRVLIYKTYKDPRTYRMNGEDIAWVRSLSGYRLGVILPKGFAFLSANVAAQLSTTADGRLKLAFANPSGQSNPVTIHARKTTATFEPSPFTDMFFDDVKTLYDLDAPETARVSVEQIYSDYRKGDKAHLDSLSYLVLDDLKVIDLDTANALTVAKDGTAKLEVPITDDKQSAHLKITGKLKDAGYKVAKDELVFERTMKGMRNTVLLPAGWEVSWVSQSGTIGQREGRAFVALINLNAENMYKVTIRARRAKTS